MSRSKVKFYEEKEIDSVSEMFKNRHQQRHRIVDYECLPKYNQRNKHFSVEIIAINAGGGQQLIGGYNCVYRYKEHKVNLQFKILNEKWTLVSDKNHEEEEKVLNAILQRINSDSSINMCRTLDEEIQSILKNFDDYFLELDQEKEAKESKEEMSKPPSVSQKENELECVDDELIKPSSSTDSEDDEQQQQKDKLDEDFHSSITESQLKMNDLVPLPSITPVRRRRVIESILVHVQRKNKAFEKTIDVFKGTKIPTMHELGLEFLRVYDGKFNYREGHTIILPFRKKIWFLTIEQIICVDCLMGESEPRSVLTLNYKSQYTWVHV